MKSQNVVDRKQLAQEALRLLATIGHRGRVTGDMDKGHTLLLTRAGMLEGDQLSILGLSIVEVLEGWDSGQGRHSVRTLQMFLTDVIIRADDLTRIYKDGDDAITLPKVGDGS